MDIHRLRIAALLLRQDEPMEKVAGVAGAVLKAIGRGSTEAVKSVGKGATAAGEHMAVKGFPTAGKILKLTPAAAAVGIGYKGYDEAKRQKYKYDVWRYRRAVRAAQKRQQRSR